MPSPFDYEAVAESVGEPVEVEEDEAPWLHGRRRGRSGRRDTHYPQKSRLAYILLALVFGELGVHNFYADHTSRGVAQLCLGAVTCLLFCVLLPLGLIPLLALTAWILLDIITVQEDGQGIPLG